MKGNNIHMGGAGPNHEPPTKTARDPKRIGQMLELVQGIWEKNPDLRLGQLILNVCAVSELYMMEDDKLAGFLKEVYIDEG